MRLIISLLAGLLFGLGLIVSGMTNPAKVQNFLDLFGSWDPSLAFVMGGAIAVGLPGFKLAERMNKPLFADSFFKPTRSEIDKRLIGGAVLFGIGWGIGGFWQSVFLVTQRYHVPGTQYRLHLSRLCYRE